MLGSLGSTWRILLKWFMPELKELFLRWSLADVIPLDPPDGVDELFGALVWDVDGRVWLAERLGPRTDKRTNLVLIDVVKLKRSSATRSDKWLSSGTDSFSAFVMSVSNLSDL